MTESQAVRLMLLEDHVVVRDGIRALLESEPGLHVVHSAGNAREALAAIPVVLPHLVLVDLNLPDIDGLAFLRRAAREYPHVRFLVLTSFGDASRSSEAMAAGARAFLNKTVSRDELVRAVRLVVKGETVQPRLEAPADHTQAHLTPAELRVLRMMAEGLSNEQIGRQLGTRLNTVKSQVANVLRKLGVENRTSAIRRGRELGLIS